MTTTIQNKKTLAKQLLKEAIEKNTKSYSLSSGQKELWFFQQRTPEGTAYNVKFDVKFHFSIEVSQMERAIQQLINRHAVLRSKYVIENDQIVQKIPPFEKVNLTVVDVSHEPHYIQTYIDDAFYCPFDLEVTTSRAHLFRLNETYYILSWVFHHIALDYRSAKILSDELIEIIRAEQEDRKANLAASKVNYFDFVKYQSQFINSSRGEAAQRFWQQKLSGLDGILNLPTDKPLPAVLTQNGAIATFKIPVALREKLGQFVTSEGITANTVFVMAYQILLYHYTRQQDFLISVTADLRPDQDYDNTIGDFISMLPVRSHISPDMTIKKVIEQTQTNLLEAYEHQDYPYGTILEHVDYKKENSHSPLTQAWFNYLSGHFKFGELQTHPSKPIEVKGGQDTGIVELFLEIFDYEGEECAFELIYNTDLFEEASIQRMGHNYRTILEGIVSTGNESTVASLPYLSLQEKEQLLVSFNDTSLWYSTDQCTHIAFEEQAKLTPNKLAVVCGEKRMTYKELDERSNQLAHYLQQQGIGANMLVGLAVDRSVEMIIAMLGILKAGGAYVPIDPEYPAERTNYMLEQSQASVLVTQKHLLAQFSFTPKVVCMDSDWDEIAIYSTTPLQLDISSENLAYSIFTSGSTGKPKGVMITHRNLYNFLNTMGVEPGLKESDSWLAITSLSFDIAGLEIWLPLIRGASCILSTTEQNKDATALSNLLEEYGVTIMQATPATWRLLIASNWQGKKDLKILCGGEPLPLHLAEQLLPRCAELWNMYGPTETTIWSSIWQVKEAIAPILIGKPIANTQMYVLDENLMLAPIGVAGELYIGGDGVAKGYLNRPDLTAERFLINPVTNDANDIIYKTGDSARWLADGNLEIFGRLDNQVKIRGFRIELGEIENALANYSVIKEAVALVDESTQGEKRLSAFFTTSVEQPVDLATLRDHLSAILPAYMIPNRLVEIEEMPLTLNGKIDRKALAALKTKQVIVSEKGADLPPKTTMQQQIAEIWQEVLQLKSVGIHDNFFDLGGHSLLLIQVHQALQRQLKRAIPILVLFRFTSIHKLAQHLEEENDSSSTVTENSSRGANRMERRLNINRRSRTSTSRK